LSQAKKSAGHPIIETIRTAIAPLKKQQFRLHRSDPSVLAATKPRAQVFIQEFFRRGRINAQELVSISRRACNSALFSHLRTISMEEFRGRWI
jgi:hypothetical protein